MKDYEKAYKAYDIRGVYGEQVDTTLAYALGKAIGGKALEKDGPKASIIISCDVREYNNQLIYYFIKGCEEVGCTNIIGIGRLVENVGGQQQKRGVASTALFYYLCKDTTTIGVQFTASHNPPQYAGCKIVDHESHLIDTALIKTRVNDEYIMQLEHYDEADFQHISTRIMDAHHPLRSNIEQRFCQLQQLLIDKFATLEKKYKIVVDFSNGAGVAYEKKFLEEMLISRGYEIIFLNDKADATFSSHFSDTTNPHDYEQLVNEVRQQQADLGIMFDGDADRLGVVDNEGNIVGGDTTVAIITENILRKAPLGSAVVYDVTSTQAIVDVITKYQGTPVPSRVGHRFMKEKYIEHQAIFGGELSGHFFFQETGGLENTMFALYHILDELSRYESCADMVKTINPYYKPPLTNYEVHNKDEVLERLKKHFTGYDIDFTDGIRINMTDFRFLVRASNTEPILRVYSEAKDEKTRHHHMQEVNQLLGVSI